MLRDAVTAVLLLCFIGVSLFLTCQYLMPCAFLVWSSPESAGERNRSHNAALFNYSWFHLFMAAVTFVTTQFIIVAPFGKHSLTINESNAAAASQKGNNKKNTHNVFQWLWYFTLPSWLSWLIQESPTLINVLYFVLVEYPFLLCRSDAGSATSYRGKVFGALSFFNLGIVLFVIHYTHRVLIYPLNLYLNSRRSPRRGPQPVPLCVTLSAAIYCLLNGRLQVLASLLPLNNDGKTARVDTFAFLFSGSSLTSCVVLLACLALGSLLFFRGMFINLLSDYTLLSLRIRSQEKKEEHSTDPGATAGHHRRHHYVIPTGGYFDLLTCPNFYGEIVEWLGFVLVVLATTTAGGGDDGAATSFSGVLSNGRVAAATSFFVYVLSNLVPRAAAHHQWYRVTFGAAHYDSLRRYRVIPGVY